MGCRAQTRPAASGAYLAALEHPESAATRRVYGYTLRALADRFGADMALAAFDEPAGAAAVSGWFEQCWGARAPATFNRNLDALRSAARHWRNQGWLHSDPTAALRRRARPPDRTRALSRADIDDLLSRRDVALRERVLWRAHHRRLAGPLRPRLPGRARPLATAPRPRPAETLTGGAASAGAPAASPPAPVGFAR